MIVILEFYGVEKSVVLLVFECDCLGLIVVGSVI